jgi:hypothetical protein
MMKLEFVQRPAGYYWELKRDDRVIATHAKPFKSYKAMLDSVIGMVRGLQDDKFACYDYTGEHGAFVQRNAISTAGRRTVARF